MKIKSFCLMILFSVVTSLHPFSQENKIVVKAWAIEETTMGGAAPPKNEKPLNRIARSFFLETKPGPKVKIDAVWIGQTAFSVYEEKFTENAPDRDYRPAGMAATKNNFIQVLATDTLKAKCIGKPPVLTQGNEAVIEFSSEGKKYYAPIKAIEHTQINLP